MALTDMIPPADDGTEALHHVDNATMLSEFFDTLGDIPVTFSPKDADAPREPAPLKDVPELANFYQYVCEQSHRLLELPAYRDLNYQSKVDLLEHIFQLLAVGFDQYVIPQAAISTLESEWRKELGAGGMMEQFFSRRIDFIKALYEPLEGATDIQSHPLMARSDEVGRRAMLALGVHEQHSGDEDWPAIPEPIKPVLQHAIDEVVFNVDDKYKDVPTLFIMRMIRDLIIEAEGCALHPELFASEITHHSAITGKPGPIWQELEDDMFERAEIARELAEKNEANAHLHLIEVNERGLHPTIQEIDTAEIRARAGMEDDTPVTTDEILESVHILLGGLHLAYEDAQGRVQEGELSEIPALKGLHDALVDPCRNILNLENVRHHLPSTKGMVASLFEKTIIDWLQDGLIDGETLPTLINSLTPEQFFAPEQLPQRWGEHASAMHALFSPLVMQGSVNMEGQLSRQVEFGMRVRRFEQFWQQPSTTERVLFPQPSPERLQLMHDIVEQQIMPHITDPESFGKCDMDTLCRLYFLTAEVVAPDELAVDELRTALQPDSKHWRNLVATAKSDPTTLIDAQTINTERVRVESLGHAH